MDYEKMVEVGKRDAQRLEALQGRDVWYYDKREGWVAGTLHDPATKNGWPVACVSLPHRDGFTKWGYGWQFKTYAEAKPEAPDLSNTYP
jgi:hypothetical protein